jgi:hypothetical protein
LLTEDLFVVAAPCRDQAVEVGVGFPGVGGHLTFCHVRDEEALLELATLIRQVPETL